MLFVIKTLSPTVESYCRSFACEGISVMGIAKFRQSGAFIRLSWSESRIFIKIYVERMEDVYQVILELSL